MRGSECACAAISMQQTSHSIPSTCDSRKYTYYFPSYLLIPPKPGSGMHNTLKEHPDESPQVLTHPFWSDSSADSTNEQDMARKRQFRAPDESVQRLREIVKKYEGTRNFHNFTVGREHSDRSCSRIMKKIEVG